MALAEMKRWKHQNDSIYNWILGLDFPTSRDEDYDAANSTLPKDVSIEVLQNSEDGLSSPIGFNGSVEVANEVLESKNDGSETEDSGEGEIGGGDSEVDEVDGEENAGAGRKISSRVGNRKEMQHFGMSIASELCTRNLMEPMECENLPKNPFDEICYLTSRKCDNLSNRFQNVCLDKHFEEKQIVSQNLDKRFHSWKAKMLSGFHLLLYGFGSKRLILDSFAHKCLRDGICAVINGFVEVVQMKEVLLSVLNRLPQNTLHNAADPSLDQIVQEFERLRNTSNRWEVSRQMRRTPSTAYTLTPVYFAIHSIDSPSLRQFQKLIAYLAGLPNVHIITTVDNVKCTALWDSSDAVSLNFICEKCNTFADYRTEILESNSGKIPIWMSSTAQATEDYGKEAKANLNTILPSLTDSHKDVVRSLATILLEASTFSEIRGLKNVRVATFSLLLKKLHKMLVVRDKSRLEDLLKELVSHEVVLMDRVKGELLLSMPYSDEILHWIQKFK